MNVRVRVPIFLSSVSTAGKIVLLVVEHYDLNALVMDFSNPVVRGDNSYARGAIKTVATIARPDS